VLNEVRHLIHNFTMSRCSLHCSHSAACRRLLNLFLVCSLLECGGRGEWTAWVRFVC